MAMSEGRIKKVNRVSSLKSSLQCMGLGGSAVLIQHRGLTSSELSALRRSLQEKSVSFQVVKNTLAELALQGTSFEALASYLSGPMAIAFAMDPIATARSVEDFSKTNKKVQAVCGVSQGKFLTCNEVRLLAAIPALEKSRSEIIYLVQELLGLVVGILQQYYLYKGVQTNLVSQENKSIQ